MGSVPTPTEVTSAPGGEGSMMVMFHILSTSLQTHPNSVICMSQAILNINDTLTHQIFISVACTIIYFIL